MNFKAVNVHLKGVLSMIFISLLLFFASTPAFAHCDSYDGPVIKDAIKALETNNVKLVFKWITPEQEAEITGLFDKVQGLKNGDREIYSIVEKHFFETLVRLHRETEGAPYTGLKPAGTTKQIIVMSDKAIENDDIDKLLAQLNNHIGSVIREKYNKVAALDKVKDNSAEEGRAYVKAYVDYTHSLEALHDILENGGGHNH
ncbi:hypothetical protein SDC9_71775 [bioreactor metagenome]|uniref:Uncharacterized protein n=1 Tax=bioreactor metagenome TaxID=1076179 RepID=A0A644Y9R2_9ZZZZ